MNTINYYLTNYPLISILISLMGILVSIVIAILQRNRRKLVFTYSTNVLVSNKTSQLAGLDVFYKQDRIDQLSVTNIDFRNAGNRIIEKDNFHDGCEITIVPNTELEILDAKVERQSCNTIGCNLIKNENSINLYFRAIEKEEAVSIIVYHTGDKHTTFEVNGKIKEGDIFYYNIDEEKFIDKFEIIMAWMFGGALLALMADDEINSYTFSQNAEAFLLMVSTLLLAIVVSRKMAIWFYRRMKRTEKKFTAYLEKKIERNRKSCN